MRQSYYLIILFSAIFQNSFGQVHLDWKQADMDLINEIITLDRSNPRAIEDYFNKHSEKTEKNILGFGWTKSEKTIGAGYISMLVSFFYYKDTIKTYILQTRLPDEKKLLREYQLLYNKFLPLHSENTYYYKYQEVNILQPLRELKKSQLTASLPSNILNYMSPTSGIMYGYRGGNAMDLLQNRKAFVNLEQMLKSNEVIAMMYSINPSSRLTAIEYYLKHKTKFNKSKEVNDWINKVYLEVPKIETLSGCNVSRENSKQLVELYVKSKLR